MEKRDTEKFIWVSRGGGYFKRLGFNGIWRLWVDIQQIRTQNISLKIRNQRTR